MSSTNNPTERREEERKNTRTRTKMRGLMEDVRNDDSLKADPTKLKEKMEEADGFLDDIKTTAEGKIDAQMFKKFAEIHRSHTETIDTNDRRFLMKEFARKLVSAMNGCAVDEGAARPTKEEWIAFGKGKKNLFKRSPSLSFLLGSYDSEEKRRPVRKPREKEAQGRSVRQSATKVTEITASRPEDDRVELLVKSIFRQLESDCSASRTGRVGYFDFVLDPSDFGRSVENMFHLSFLIKARKVLLSENATTGLLELETLVGLSGASGSAGAEDDARDDQIIITINKAQWRELVELLGIRTARIKVDQETVRQTATKDGRKRRRRQI